MSDFLVISPEMASSDQSACSSVLLAAQIFYSDRIDTSVENIRLGMQASLEMFRKYVKVNVTRFKQLILNPPVSPVIVDVVFVVHVDDANNEN